MSNGPLSGDDARLLADVARVWRLADPPPVDLADGVLARIAAEDLEFDLLTLVESSDALAGVRSAAEPELRPEPGDTGSWTLEYAAPDLRIHLSLTRTDGHTRLDGWVVPARPLTVRLAAHDAASGSETTVDEFGRFEFAAATAGLVRLTLLPPPRTAERPRITPPFWI
jgi:hypothetical protein